MKESNRNRRGLKSSNDTVLFLTFLPVGEPFPDPFDPSEGQNNSIIVVHGDPDVSQVVEAVIEVLAGKQGEIDPTTDIADE